MTRWQTAFQDSRYREFSEAFGFGPGEIRGALRPGFVDDIIAKFQANSFEVENRQPG